MGNTVVKMNYYALLAESDHEEIEICEVDLVSVWPGDEQHYKIMLTMMNYFVGTRNQGLFLKSMKNLDGKDMLFEFEIHSQSESDYAKNPKK